MAQTHKRLYTGQPAAATNTTGYTAPASTKAIISSIFCCNTGSETTIRVFLVPNGDAAGVDNALYYDLTIRAGDTFLINGVPVLEESDFLVFYSVSGGVTFTVSGLELT
jgi:hypothetical protein